MKAGRKNSWKTWRGLFSNASRLARDSALIEWGYKNWQRGQRRVEMQQSEAPTDGKDNVGKEEPLLSTVSPLTKPYLSPRRWAGSHKDTLSTDTLAYSLSLHMLPPLWQGERERDWTQPGFNKKGLTQSTVAMNIKMKKNIKSLSLFYRFCPFRVRKFTTDWILD